MNVLLVAINAKYIHSNLAVHSLRAYGEKATGEKIAVAEYTINQPEEDILKDIYRRRPDWLGFSCYIWNINTVKVLLPELRKLLPDCEIWLGGPEVSFEGTKMLEKFPDADGIMKGEGEQIFADLLGRKLNSEGKIFEKDLRKYLTKLTKENMMEALEDVFDTYGNLSYDVEDKEIGEFLGLSEEQLFYIKAISRGNANIEDIVKIKKALEDKDSKVYYEDYLYDLDNDPDEKMNLVNDKNFKEIRKTLSKQLTDEMEKAWELKPKIRSAVFNRKK